ncbi:MAG: DUF6456 domain-containing protein [Jhaorihella sp.]
MLQIKWMSLYLAHTMAGQAIRDLARGAGCHASTVLRQIRRIETRRDDPLVDGALTALAATHFPPLRTRQEARGAASASPKDISGMKTSARPEKDALDNAALDREALRVLRRLCESGAVLAVAEQMEKAVVVRDAGAGDGTRTAVVERSVAEAMALKDWIGCANPGRISRYRITAAGRAALGRLIAQCENRARAHSESGFGEAQAVFAGPDGDGNAAMPGEPGDRARRVRYHMADSPLILLARRRDRDGRPFLDDALVVAGERLREDFEMAQTGPRVAQNWEHYLTGGVRGGPGAGAGCGADSARDRVARALADLGPGLSDVALRCCCYLEGLEQAERRMGWSARSGKIVLRIALQRLRRHYEQVQGADRLIG